MPAPLGVGTIAQHNWRGVIRSVQPPWIWGLWTRGGGRGCWWDLRSGGCYVKSRKFFLICAASISDANPCQRNLNPFSFFNCLFLQGCSRQHILCRIREICIIFWREASWISLMRRLRFAFISWIYIGYSRSDLASGVLETLFDGLISGEMVWE